MDHTFCWYEYSEGVWYTDSINNFISWTPCRQQDHKDHKTFEER